MQIHIGGFHNVILGQRLRTEFVVISDRYTIYLDGVKIDLTLIDFFEKFGH